MYYFIADYFIWCLFTYSVQLFALSQVSGRVRGLEVDVQIVQPGICNDGSDMLVNFAPNCWVGKAVPISSHFQTLYHVTLVYGHGPSTQLWADSSAFVSCLIPLEPFGYFDPVLCYR